MPPTPLLCGITHPHTHTHTHTPANQIIDTPTIAEDLAARGYRTHLVGKWHVGHSRRRNTPVGRGFHEAYGMYNAAHGHYSKYFWSLDVPGYDLFDGSNPAALNATHDSELFSDRAAAMISNHVATSGPSSPFFLYLAYTAAHSPLMAPDVDLAACTAFRTPKRRKFCGLVSSLDRGLGTVIDSLKADGVWNDTLLIFTSDNGGQVPLPSLVTMQTPTMTKSFVLQISY